MFDRVEFVTITPEGFRYRAQIFPSVNGLFRWFKDHYQEPVPGEKVRNKSQQNETGPFEANEFSFYFTDIGITPSSCSRTRTPASINATPANINIAGLFSVDQYNLCLVCYGIELNGLLSECHTTIVRGFQCLI